MFSLSYHRNNTGINRDPFKTDQSVFYYLPIFPAFFKWKKWYDFICLSSNCIIQRKAYDLFSFFVVYKDVSLFIGSYDSNIQGIDQTLKTGL